MIEENAQYMLIKQLKRKKFDVYTQAQSPLCLPIKESTYPFYSDCFLLTRLLNRITAAVAMHINSKHSSNSKMDCFLHWLNFPFGFCLLFFVYVLFWSYCAHWLTNQYEYFWSPNLSVAEGILSLCKIEWYKRKKEREIMWSKNDDNNGDLMGNRQMFTLIKFFQTCSYVWK
jgi:hypothetical protein